MSISSTSFILVPGGFCPGILWERVSSLLEKHGHEAVEIDHLTINGPNRETTTFMDDAENVRSIAANRLDQGKKVVLVGNSYGGLVITEAAKGLDKSERAANGKLGLSHLVFVASLLSPLGITCNELLSRSASVNPAEGQTKTILDPPGPPEAVGAALMSELPDDKQKYYGSQLRTQAAAAFDEKLTHQGYLHTPTTVVITENDKVLDPKRQHESVDTAVANGAENITKLTINTDHCAMLTRPEEIVQILIDVAK